MYFESEEVKLKDGRTCILKCADEGDAEGMVDYLKISAGETEFILRYPDEVTYTIEGEKEIINTKRENPYEAFVVAVVDGEVAGNCAVCAHGVKRKIRHRANFGIALISKYWNLGIGNALMKKSIELAKDMGFEQLELEVAGPNVKAQHLYEKYGYKKIGERPKALKLDNGEYYSEYLMVLDLTEA